MIVLELSFQTHVSQEQLKSAIDADNALNKWFRDVLRQDARWIGHVGPEFLDEISKLVEVLKRRSTMA